MQCVVSEDKILGIGMVDKIVNRLSGFMGSLQTMYSLNLMRLGCMNQKYLVHERRCKCACVLYEQ